MHFHAERRRDTWPPLDTTFFETVAARKIALSPAIRSYLREFVGIDPTPSNLREFRMEEVFKDVSYDFRETPSNDTALNAYIDLVDLYLRVLRETTNWLCAPKRRGGPVGRLLDAAARNADSLSVVTFNHDLVIENEIERRAKLRARWCLDQGYGSISSELNPLNPTESSEPIFRLHNEGDCDHGRPITLLKLHGSLNWVMRINGARPTARFLQTGGGNRKLHLSTRRQIMFREIYMRGKGSSGRSQWQLWPVVVPPVYAKQAMRAETLRSTWADAGAAIRSADRIVFYGYSLPQLDVEAEKLVERALLQNKIGAWIDVINPAASAAGRFAAVAKSVPVHWYPNLQRYLEADTFAET